MVAHIITPEPRSLEIIGKVLPTCSLELMYQGLGKERQEKLRLNKYRMNINKRCLALGSNRLQSTPKGDIA